MIRPSPPHQQTLYQYNHLHPSSADTIPVHQQPYILYYPLTYCHQTLLHFIRHLPTSIPNYSSLYIPSSAEQIRLQIVKIRSYYYQSDATLISRPFISTIIFNPHHKTLFQFIISSISFITPSPITIRPYSGSFEIYSLADHIPVYDT